MTKVLLFIWMAFSAGSLFSADKTLDLRAYSSPADRSRFVQCNRENYASEPCKALLREACRQPENRDVFMCWRQTFDDCKQNGNFRSGQCQNAAELICDDTRDQYDFRCSRFRYEKCKEKHFEGEFSFNGEKMSCQRIRYHYTIPILEKDLEGVKENSKVDYYYRSRNVDHNEPTQVRATDQWFARNYKIFTCDIINRDKTHERFNEFCGVAEQDILPMDWELFVSILDLMFFDEWEHKSIKDIGDLLPLLLREVPKDEIARLKKLNNISDFETVPSVSPRDIYQQMDAVNIWLEYFDEYADSNTEKDKQIARLLTKLLAYWGDDSLITTFALLRASEAGDAEVESYAIKGLAMRTYDSGIALSRLLKALSSTHLETRSQALVGLGRRWNQQLQSNTWDVNAREALKELLNCISAGPMSSQIYSGISKLSDFNELDHSDPQVLCNIGTGARLRRLRSELVNRYKSILTNPNSKKVELLAVFEGYSHVASITAEQAELALDDLVPSFKSVDDRNFHMATLPFLKRLINKVSNQTQYYNEIHDKVMPIVKSSLSEVAAKSLARNNLKDESLLDTIELIDSLRANEILLNSSRGWRDELSSNCVLNSSLPDFLRIACFKLTGWAMSTVVLPDNRAILDIIKVSLSDSSSYRFSSIPIVLKTEILELMSSGQFQFLREENGSVNIDDCEARKQVGDLMVARIKESLESGLVKNWSSFSDIYSTFEKITKHDDRAIPRCKLGEFFGEKIESLKQADDKRIPKTLLDLLEKSFPRIDLLPLYNRYTPSNQVDVIKYHDKIGGYRVDVYMTSDDSKKAFRSHLIDRQFQHIFLEKESPQTMKNIFSIFVLDKDHYDREAVIDYLWNIDLINDGPQED